MKKKFQEYLPLKWCKKFTFELQGGIREDFNIDEALDMSAEWRLKHNESVDVALKMCTTFFKDCAFDMLEDRIVTECASEVDTFALLQLWSKDKQVFRFDCDFLEALVDTKNISLTRDAYKHLPFKSFYVDLTASPDICGKIAGDGFFVTTRLNDDNWDIHLCKITDKYFFTDVMRVPNLDTLARTSLDKYDVSVLDLDEETSTITESFVTTDYSIYQTIVLQILTYLSSAEPEYNESEETKYTYRAPSGPPKNKFSEIRKWEVGVRIGTRIRTFKQRAASSSGGQGGLGIKKRPHVRRAHWRHIDVNGEKRALWINVAYVNM